MPTFVAQPELIIRDFNCDSTSKRKRALDSCVFWLKGKPFLVVNIGNGLEIRDISSPLKPVYVSGAPTLTRGYLGETPFNLSAFSVCDGGRFGVAAFPGGSSFSARLGATLFDLGTDHVPKIQEWHQFGPDALGWGAFTFKHDGQQYLLIGGMPYEDTQWPEPSAGLFLFDGIQPENLTRIQDVDLPGGRLLNIINGYYIPSAKGTYLYLFDFGKDGHIYEVTGRGASLRLTHLRTVFRGHFIQCHGMRVDLARMIAAQTAGDTAILWDISDPAHPRVLAEWKPIQPYSSVALAGSLLWLGRGSAAHGPSTYDTSDPKNPVPLDQGFWDLDNQWNVLSACFNDIDGVASPDAKALYLSRYSGLQLISTNGGTPMPDVFPEPNNDTDPVPTHPPATVPIHGHIDPGFNPPLDPGTARISMSLVGSSENHTEFATGDRVLLKAFGGVDSSKLDHVNWGFGDGTGTTVWSSPFDSGMAVEHSYAAPGGYTVSVEVHLTSGAFLTGSASLTVTGESVEAPSAPTPPVVEPETPPIAPTTGPVTDARPAEVKVFIEVKAVWDDLLQAYLVTLG